MLLLLSVPAFAGNDTNKKQSVKFRGLKSVDTFNVDYSRFSPFNNEDNERHGHSFGVKTHIRPLRSGKMDLGGYLSYSKGKGDTFKKSKNRWSHYRYKKIGGGISGVYNHSADEETTFDVGLLHQKTDYWVPSKAFASHQDEMQWEFGIGYDSELRRSNGEKWFPKWSLYAHYIHPFNISYSDSKGRSEVYAYDNRVFRFGGDFDIYDVYLDENNRWRITPTINVGSGYLWGKDSWFMQGGLGSKISWYNEEMLDVKLFNPRWVFGGNGSKLYDVIGTIKIDNVFRAVWASRTKKYEAKRNRAKMIAQAIK